MGRGKRDERERERGGCGATLLAELYRNCGRLSGSLCQLPRQSRGNLPSGGGGGEEEEEEGTGRRWLSGRERGGGLAMAGCLGGVEEEGRGTAVRHLDVRLRGSHERGFEKQRRRGCPFCLQLPPLSLTAPSRAPQRDLCDGLCSEAGPPPHGAPLGASVRPGSPGDSLSRRPAAG